MKKLHLRYVGSVTPITGILDDGNTTMNAVFFGDSAKNLAGKAVEEVEEELKSKPVGSFIKDLGILTKKFKVNGTTRINQLSNELEIRIKNIERSE